MRIKQSGLFGDAEHHAPGVEGDLQAAQHKRHAVFASTEVGVNPHASFGADLHGGREPGRTAHLASIVELKHQLDWPGKRSQKTTQAVLACWKELVQLVGVAQKLPPARHQHVLLAAWLIPIDLLHGLAPSL